MPDWCKNRVLIRHTDPEKISRLIDAFNRNELCNEFIPMPNNEWDCYWCWENWGTKWDIECENSVKYFKDVELDFKSAWSPPLGLYNELEKQGYKVYAFDVIEGCNIVHSFEFGKEYCYDLDDRVSMPVELNIWLDDMGYDMESDFYEDETDDDEEEEEDEEGIVTVTPYNSMTTAWWD